MKLLCAIDFSESTIDLIKSAEKLGTDCNATLVLTHVMPPDENEIEFQPIIEAHFKPRKKYYTEPDSTEKGDSVPILHNRKYQLLQTITEWLKEKGISSEISIVHGNEVDGIIEQAAKHETDMILLGSHGHKALYQLLIGSVCEGVLRKAAIPVVIVPKGNAKKNVAPPAQD